MQIVVLTDDLLKEELLSNGTVEGTGVVFIQRPEEFSNYPGADAYIDLLFEKEDARISLLYDLLPKPVIINSVVYTLGESHPRFTRINGWPTFLQSPVVEAAAADDNKAAAGSVLSQFNKTPEWLPDHAGFVTARVVSMILNEAYIALAEGVSSKEDINTAMKLGTNYPYGPFEWAEKIGVQNIISLLQALAIDKPQYTPDALLAFTES